MVLTIVYITTVFTAGKQGGHFLKICFPVDDADILVVDLYGDTYLQYPVVNAAVCQVRRVLQFFQCQICGYNHRFFAAVSCVNYIRNLLQRKFRTALHAEVVQNQQAVAAEAVNLTVPVLLKHPGKGIQYPVECGHENGNLPVDQRIGDTTGKESFARSDTAP